MSATVVAQRTVDWVAAGETRSARGGGAPRRATVWIAEHEPLAVLALAPLLLAARPEALALLSAAALPLLWLLVARVRGDAAVTGFDPPLLWFLLLLPLPLLPVVDGGPALPRLLGLLLGIALLRALARGLPSRRALGWAGRAFSTATAGVALAGLVFTDWIAGKLLPLEPLYARLPRVALVSLPHSRAGGIHPNEIAGALALLLPIAVAAALAERGRASVRLLPWAGAGFGLLVLVLTQSRMGYLGALCGLAALLLGWLATRGQPWSAALALASLPGLLTASGLLARRLLAGGPISGRGEALDTLAARLELWDRSLAILQDFPLTGTGLGQLSGLLHTVYVPFLIPPGTWVPHAHNEVLQVWLDLGVPAGSAYFVLLGLGVLRLVQTALRGPADHRLLALGCLGGLLGFQVFGLADAIAPGARPAVLIWAVLGYAEALWRASGQRPLDTGPRG